MTEEERDEMMRSNWKAQMAGLGYGTDGMALPQEKTYGWISVKDRLPEKNQIVIASDGEHTWDVGMYKSFCGKPSEWNWKKNTIKTVLWWMPKDGALLEPPKEES